MANRFLSNIRINDAYTFPASDGTSGQVIGTDGAGNLSFINIESEAGSTVIYKDNFSGDNSTVTFELAHVVSDEVVTQVYMDGVYQNKDTYIVSGDQITFDSAPPTGVEIEVISFNTVSTQGIIAYNSKNSTGSTIAAGTAVMAVGTDGNSGHILIAPMVADGSVEPKYFMGITADEVLNGEYVDVVHFGVIGKINTSSFSDGDVLWLDPANNGGFTVTEPNAPSIKMAAAIVLNSGTNGKIFVRVQGNEGLHELHDVHIENLANQDILVYNTTQGYWENSKTLGDITTGNITTDGTVDGVDVSAFKAAYDVHTHVEGDITDFGNYLTNITHDTVNNKLVVTTRDAATFDVDLTQYIDDSNLARLTSGSLDAATGIATFTRDDATTFTVDFSALFDDTDTNDFLTGASFDTADGVLTLNVSNQTDVTVDLDGRYLESYTETDPTVPSHVKTISTTDISNWDTAYGWGNHADAGYLTSYTETDTLATVTARGASTTGGITVNGTITLPQNPVGTTYGNGVSTVPSYMIQQGAGDNDGIRLYAEAGVTNDVRFIFEVVDDIETGDTWVFRNKKTYTDYLANEVVKISGAGDITASGTLSASGYNNSNWDTAYGWGDHSTAGYQAASSAITTSNIGSQSVDNADKVDGYHASGLLRLGEPTFGAGTGEDISGPIEFIRDTGASWDDYIIKHGSTKGMFGKKGVGWHAHTDSSFHVMSSGWVSNFGVNSDGTTVSRTSSRAPIFYDLDNTGHYVNPAGDSYFSQITIANDTPIKFYGAGADTYTLSAIYCNSTNWVLEAPLKSNSGSGVHVPIYLTWRGGYSAQGGVKIDDGYTEISGSIYSPIFYDSNDTSYYTDPASTSVLNTVKFGTVGGSWGSAMVSTGSSAGWGTGAYPWIGSNGGSTGSLIMLHNPHIPFRTDNGRSGASGRAGIRCAIDTNASDWWDIGLYGDAFEIYRNASGLQMFHVDNARNSYSWGSSRAPIFYDSDNTGYFINANGTSNIGGGNDFPLRVSKSSGYNSGCVFFQNNAGDNSWGIVGEFRVGGGPGTDRPSIMFSHGFNNNTWSIGFGTANDDNFRIKTDHGHRHSSWGTDRMVLDRSGNVSFSGSVSTNFIDIDKTSANGPGMDLTFSGTNSTGILIRNNTGTTTSAVLFYYSSAPQGARGSITVSSTSTAYNTSSDYRLKENVIPMTGSLERVDQLNPTRFNFIGDDKTVDGFLAHEAAEVVPEAVTGTKDEVDEEGNPIYQGIDQAKLVPLLVGAIQELKAEVEALKQQLNGIN